MAYTASVVHDNKSSPRSSFENLAQENENGLDLNFGHDGDAGGGIPLIEDGLSLLSIDQDIYQDSLPVRTPQIQFEAAQCLFCKCRSVDLDKNMEHMLRAHSFIIPDRGQLIVDVETLVEYFHLVIFGYFECLYCGSQRSNVQGAQQHMIGKGHCKIDISNQDSEFRDFYEFDTVSEDSDDGNDDPKVRLSNAAFVDVDKSMRLSSGKVLSHRAQGKPRVSRHGIPRAAIELASSTPASCTSTISGSRRDESEPAPSHDAPSPSKRVAKREASFLNQLATLRDSDRRSLMHLSVAEQRAVVLRGKRLVEKANRDQNEMLLKIQLRANKTAKK